MAKSIEEGILSALSGYNQARDRKEKSRQSNFDNAYKQAQLQSMGYDVQEGPGGQFNVRQTGQFNAVPEGYTQYGGKLYQKVLTPQEKAQEQSEAIKAQLQAFGSYNQAGNSQESGASENQFSYGDIPMVPTGVGANGMLTYGKDPIAVDLMKEEMKNKEANDRRSQMILDKARDTINTINEIKKGEKYFGYFGDMPTKYAPSNIMGEYDDRRNWEANAEKLKSSLVLDLMNEMKQASRTGATGFGQLSEKELAILQSSASAFNRSLGRDDALKYLSDIENKAKKVLGNEEIDAQVPSWVPDEYREDYALGIQRGLTPEQLQELARRNGAI